MKRESSRSVAGRELVAAGAVADGGVAGFEAGGRELSVLLQALPGATVQRKLHNASLLVGGKVFAFTRGEAMVLKLPRERVAELVLGGAAMLVMGKRVMKEWVVVECAGDRQLELLREAMGFVGSVG